MSKQTERDAFRSRWGFILACIGSAVGMSENTVRKYVPAARWAWATSGAFPISCPRGAA